jgi:hypothetical protein
MTEKTPTTLDIIRVVFIYRGKQYQEEFLQQNPDLRNRFPDNSAIQKNYAELKKRQLAGTIEVWQHMILVKDEDRNVLWQDVLV